MRPHQRTVEAAIFELPRGYVSIAELMAMEQSRWDHIRNEINLRRARSPSNPLARCALCEASVFIRSQAIEGGHLPVFAHYADAPPSCPWHEGANLKPDDARAAQYQGHQESALHKWLCKTIADLAKADRRCLDATINTYLRPAIECRGRWPDILLRFENLGRIAVEAQISKPFAPEVAARHIFYEAEGIPLIWVFHGLDLSSGDELPQGFRDVISMQRGNAFVFDQQALAASFSRSSLVLSCFLESQPRGFLKPSLVTLDELNLATGRSVFLEDRRSKRLLTYCKDGRKKWWGPLRETDLKTESSPFHEKRFNPAWDSIRMYVPELSDWRQQHWLAGGGSGQAHFVELVAMLFSIAASAHSGDDTLYVSRYEGEGRLIAMLNSKLAGTRFKPYATLIETMIRSSSVAPRLDRATWRSTLASAKAAVAQVQPGHAVWTAVRRIFPEAFDGPVRAEMMELGCLPLWAKPPEHEEVVTYEEAPHGRRSRL